MTDRIYLDNAATTEMLPEVQAAMEPYYSEHFGNASANYSMGREAREIIERARVQVAASIMAKPGEIFFTSGGSESDNWAIKNTAGERKHEGRHIITSAIEHHAVLHSCEYLQSLDYKLSYLKVKEDGIVDLEQLEQTLRKSEYSEKIEDKVSLISIMYANNEIGTLQPIEEIGTLARRKGIIFHTDAVQAVGQLPISVHRLPIDMLSASGHKFHGPKGVGFLYVREGVELPSFIHGGAQEGGKRAGTENVAGIVGMAKALQISTREIGRKSARLTQLRDYFKDRVLREIPQSRLNGNAQKRLPGNLNFSFKGIQGNALLQLLERQGIYASAGSACSAGITNISHVIEALGVPKEYAHGTIRFSLGRDTTKEEIDRTVESLKRGVAYLRRG